MPPSREFCLIKRERPPGRATLKGENDGLTRGVDDYYSAETILNGWGSGISNMSGPKTSSPASQARRRIFDFSKIGSQTLLRRGN